MSSAEEHLLKQRQNGTDSRRSSQDSRSTERSHRSRISSKTSQSRRRSSSNERFDDSTLVFVLIENVLLPSMHRESSRSTCAGHAPSVDGKRKASRESPTVQSARKEPSGTSVSGLEETGSGSTNPKMKRVLVHSQSYIVCALRGSLCAINTLLARCVFLCP